MRILMLSRLQKVALPLVMVVAFWVAFSGLARIPIEAHEAFVLQAAQHMLDSHDWVIPFFNGEPHLTKPPLNYWLTALAAMASGDSVIQPWHGRLPSALAGVALVWLTAQVGRQLFNERIGLLAAAITATCSGFFYYTHTARPEMVYAALCALAIVAYLRARDSGKTAWAYTMWFAFALATLCKGPQLPAMLLLAFVIDQYWGGRRSWKQVLRPLGGVALMLVIAAPWWWLLHHRLGGAGLHGTQLSGTLLQVNPFANLSPYYLYRPLQLLLPWLLLLPAVFALGRADVEKRHFKLLALLVLLPALLLTFGPQKRWYYMLPSLMPMSIVLAAAVTAWIERVAMQRPVLARRVWKGLTVAMLLTTTLFVAAGMSQQFWGAGRFSHAQLAQNMKQQAEVYPGAILLTWGITPEVYSYYIGRVVQPVNTAEKIEARLAAEPSGHALLLLQDKYLADIPASLRVEVLGKAQGDADDEPALLVLLSR